MNNRLFANCRWDTDTPHTVRRRYPCSPGGCGLVQPSLQLRGHHLTPSLSRRLTVAAVQTQRTPYYRTSHIARTADQTGALQTPPRPPPASCSGQRGVRGSASRSSSLSPALGHTVHGTLLFSDASKSDPKMHFSFDTYRLYTNV